MASLFKQPVPDEFKDIDLELGDRGSTVEIHLIVVPDGKRRAGLGTRFFRWFEANLAERVTLVQVFAADYDGNGNTDGFWESLGFRWKYGGEDLSYEEAHAMWKGVNGHPTPRMIAVGPDEDDDEEPGMDGEGASGPVPGRA